MNDYNRCILAVDAAEVISRELDIPLWDLVDVLADCPTVDTVDKKKGTWKLKAENVGKSLFSAYECSECGEISLVVEKKRLCKFCPNCGADMRGEE